MWKLQSRVVRVSVWNLKSEWKVIYLGKGTTKYGEGLFKVEDLKRIKILDLYYTPKKSLQDF